MAIIALVPAAGQGVRFGAQKSFFILNHRPIAWYAIHPLLHCPKIEAVYLIVNNPPCAAALSLTALHERLFILAEGGQTRGQTVLNALSHFKEDDWVLIHDAARPCLRLNAVNRLLAESGKEGGILALPAVDALKQGLEGRIQKSVARKNLWLAQTPQFFPVNLLRQALLQFPQSADESEAMEKIGIHPKIVNGDHDNIKLTYPEDIPMIASILAQQEKI